MNSKEIYYLTTTILCMIILVHCTSNQPSSVNSILIKPSFDAESNDDSLPKLLLLHSEYNQIHPSNSLEPIRRANFWKRANFWRKRANFWRRNLAP